MELSANSSRWSIDETKILLCMWSEEHIQDQLDGTVRDSEVYKKLAAMMRGKSLNRTSSQIKSRIKILKRRYREQRDKLRTTGQSGKIKFPFFAQMDSVLGHREGTNPTGVLETSIPGLDNNGTSEHTTMDEHLNLSNVEDEEIFDSDLDITRHSLNAEQSVLGDQSVLGEPSVLERSQIGSLPELPEEQDVQVEGQMVENQTLNDSVAESQPGPSEPGPSSTNVRNRRKRKTLKDILPQTMENCVEKYINYQKEMDEEMLKIEKEQLNVEKENLAIKREALDFLKRLFE